MESTTLAEKAMDKVTTALHAIAQNEHLADIVQAFRQALVEQARWRVELPDMERPQTPDLAGFTRGIPLAGREQLIRLGTLWLQAADRLIPALAAGFPKISEKLLKIHEAIKAGAFSADGFMDAVHQGRDQDARDMAAKLGLEPELLLFVLVRIARPVVEKRAQAYQTCSWEQWNRGYCPVCGSYPELSILREKEGQRWLRCSFCSSQWRFYRSVCPFCDAGEPGHGEMLYVEGCRHEYVEICNHCRTYLMGIDTRKLVDEIVPEVMDIRLMHLDAIAREKGFLPMRNMGWKVKEEMSETNGSA